jgi:hypothetical protein
MKKQYLLFAIIGFLLMQNGIAQTLITKPRSMLNASLGVPYYMGDLTQNLQGLRPIGIISYGRDFSQFSPKWSYHLSLGATELGAADTLSSNKDLIERGLHFRTLVIETTGTIELELLRGSESKVYRKWHLSPSIYIGLGAMYFNPRAKYEGKWYNLQPLGTDGQNLATPSNAYKRLQMIVPMGAELRYYTNKNVSFGLNVGLRKTFTDYLDDVGSRYYPDLVKLAKANPLSAALSNPNNRPITPSVTRRGSEDKKDQYVYAAVSMRYYFKWKKF